MRNVNNNQFHIYGINNNNETKNDTEYQNSFVSNRRKLLCLIGSDLDYSKLQNEENIGQGSFGIVSRGLYDGLSVAIKQITIFEEKTKKIVKNEEKILSEIMKQDSHHLVVMFIGVLNSFDLKTSNLIFEYMSGGNLREKVKNQKLSRFDQNDKKVWKIIEQICLGIKFFFSLEPQIIHRDLKPEDIIYIFDFLFVFFCK